MKEKEYNAIVKIVDKEALTHCANEYYEGDLHAAVNGELAWVNQSGLEVEIIGSEKTGYKDLELTPEMEKRNDEIESAVYDCLCILTEKSLEWDVRMIYEVIEAIKRVLADYNLKVRHPAIETDENGQQRYVEYDD